MPQTMLGPYRLDALLGRGGMGEVYRAHDTEHDRRVALKVLPASLSQDPLYRGRFQREARLASGLTDPHVVLIHRYGEIDSQLFLDVRLIEGEDLGDCLTGDRPFVRVGLPALMHAHIHSLPPRPSIRRGVPRAFDAVVARGMAKDPAQRQPTAGELAAQARAALVAGPATGAGGAADPATTPLVRVPAPRTAPPRAARRPAGPARGPAFPVDTALLLALCGLAGALMVFGRLAWMTFLAFWLMAPVLAVASMRNDRRPEHRNARWILLTIVPLTILMVVVAAAVGLGTALAFGPDLLRYRATLTTLSLVLFAVWAGLRRRAGHR